MDLKPYSIKPYAIYWQATLANRGVWILDLDERPEDFEEYIRMKRLEKGWVRYGHWILVSQSVVEETE